MNVITGALLVAGVFLRLKNLKKEEENSIVLKSKKDENCLWIITKNKQAFLKKEFVDIYKSTEINSKTYYFLKNFYNNIIVLILDSNNYNNIFSFFQHNEIHTLIIAEQLKNVREIYFKPTC